MADNIYDVKVGDKLTPAQIRQAAGGGQAEALQEIEVTAERIPLYSESKQQTEESNAEVDKEVDPPLYRYPLTITESYPAYIKFEAIKVDGADFREAFGDIGRGALDLLKNYSPAGVLYQGARTAYDAVTDNEDVSEADKEVSTEEKGGIQSGLNKLGSSISDSYENLSGGTTVGTVMLPLQQSLTFQDGVRYNEASLGIAGNAAGELLQGKNPFAGILGSNGQLSRAAAGVATQIVAKNAAAAGGVALGGIAGAAGSIVGASALGNVGEGIGAAVKNASRVTTNPNQRTLFESVNMREFAFTFKMVANNAKEAQEIRNIIKFFREEVYPLPIEANGLSLGYEFPNMFEIHIKNFRNEEPAPKIQRCYLQNVQTVYNATANSMHTDGNFVEVDVSLTFREIVALNKKKVREGY